MEGLWVGAKGEKGGAVGNKVAWDERKAGERKPSKQSQHWRRLWKKGEGEWLVWGRGTDLSIEENGKVLSRKGRAAAGHRGQGGLW